MSLDAWGASLLLDVPGAPFQMIRLPIASSDRAYYRFGIFFAVSPHNLEVTISVGRSCRRAEREMVQAILNAGYQHIGFMGTNMPLDHRAHKRFEGFTEVPDKHGIEIEDREFYSGGSTLDNGRELTQAMLDRSPEFDFQYYSNDMISTDGLLHSLDQGVNVSGQIGIAGCSNVPSKLRYKSSAGVGQRGMTQ